MELEDESQTGAAYGEKNPERLGGSHEHHAATNTPGEPEETAAVTYRLYETWESHEDS